MVGPSVIAGSLPCINRILILILALSPLLTCIDLEMEQKATEKSATIRIDTSN